MRIHRYWHEGDPPFEPFARNVLIELHPWAELYDWTWETVPFQPSCPDQLDQRNRARHCANVIRWWLLMTYGGVWLDHDVIPLEPLPPGAWCSSLNGYPTTAALSLPLGHDLPERMLHAIGAQRGRGRTSVVVSGEDVFRRTLREHELPLVPFRYDRMGRMRTDGPLLHVTTSAAYG